MKREQLEAIADTTIEDLEIPEWNCTVKIRSLSTREQLTLADEAEKAKDKNLVEKAEITQLKAIILGVLDDDGQPLFTEDHYDWLLSRPPKILKRLSDAISRVSGLGEEAQNELAKN